MLKQNDFTALEGFIFIAIAISSIAMILNLALSIGLIWAILFGLMFGSFATSFVARIPKGIMQKKADPYCMSCKHPLERRDLYTIFSYIINKGKCRFCAVNIPTKIFFTETVVTIAYIIAYLQYGFTIDYVVMSFCYFFAIIATLLLINDRFISYYTIVIVILLLIWPRAIKFSGIK
jgi:leader peptidase (prepilin peptidase)/N-methyltransferase